MWAEQMLATQVFDALHIGALESRGPLFGWVLIVGTNVGIVGDGVDGVSTVGQEVAGIY